MARLQVNTIVDRNDSGSPSFPNGVTIPSGELLTVNQNANISGVATVGFLTTSNMTVGVITATSFVGDGSGLTGLQSVDASKAIALRIVLDPLPFRS